MESSRRRILSVSSSRKAAAFSGSALEQQAEERFEIIAEIGFHAAGFQRRALDDKGAGVIQERVIFRLVAEHGRIALVEFHLDALREFRRESALEVFDLDSIRRAKIDAIGIDLDDPRAAGGEPVHHLL